MKKLILISLLLASSTAFCYMGLDSQNQYQQDMLRQQQEQTRIMQQQLEQQREAMAQQSMNNIQQQSNPWNYG